VRTALRSPGIAAALLPAALDVCAFRLEVLTLVSAAPQRGILKLESQLHPAVFVDVDLHTFNIDPARSASISQADPGDRRG
jgi:dTDP-4-amino-4,6-dideoxygalactose transaminase